MPVGQFVQINPSLVVVPFCVLNRCGAVLDPDSVKQHVKLAVYTKTYACPWQPSRAWEGWQFATQLGQYWCEVQGHTTRRWVVNIVAK
jgi:hypothetical protein